MARRAFAVTVGSGSDSQGHAYMVSSRGATDPSAALATATTDIATAVGIGTGDASVPVLATQADIALASTDVNVDVLVTFNTAKITTVSKLKAAFDEIVRQAQGSGLSP